MAKNQRSTTAKMLQFPNRSVEAASSFSDVADRGELLVWTSLHEIFGYDSDDPVDQRWILDRAICAAENAFVDPFSIIPIALHRFL